MQKIKFLYYCLNKVTGSALQASQFLLWSAIGFLTFLLLIIAKSFNVNIVILLWSEFILLIGIGILLFLYSTEAVAKECEKTFENSNIGYFKSLLVVLCMLIFSLIPLVVLILLSILKVGNFGVPN